MLSFSRRLGDEWSVKPEVIDDIERFTCLMYGQARETSMNAVRSIMLKQMVVDLSRLPPCRDSLVPHIYRVKHRLAYYKRADKATFFSPKPYDPEQGWKKTEEGILEPVWSCGPILPPSLIDWVEKTVEEVEEEEEEEEEIDYDEVLNDDE